MLLGIKEGGEMSVKDRLGIYATGRGACIIFPALSATGTGMLR
jgi:hypothetical protein